MHWEDLNDDTPPSYSPDNNIIRNNIARYKSVYENNTNSPHYYNHYENNFNQSSYDDMDAWSDLFDERRNMLRHRERNNDDEQDNTADALIERAYTLGLPSLTMKNTKFKKLSVPKNITKLEKLTSLEISNSNIDEITNFPPNLEELKVINCLISLFEASNAPSGLKTLSLENNIIELFLDGMFLTNLTEINLSSNKLKHIPILPELVEKVILNSNEIEKIENLENLSKLKYINLAGNEIKVFENIPFTVEHINLNKNKIEFIDFTGYVNLKEVRAHSNEIEIILSEFPENITYIDLSQNNLMMIPKVGEFIKYLDLSYNKLRKMPELVSIKNLETFDVTSNDLMELTDETIRKLIEIKSTVQLCFFDQFKIEETVIEQERDGLESSETSDSEDEYKQILLISEEDDNNDNNKDSNDIMIDRILLDEINANNTNASVNDNNINTNNTNNTNLEINKIEEENKQDEDNKDIKEVIKIKSKRIAINLTRSYDL